MGEVRVKVRLTNASDEALARRGQLPGDQVRSYEADALVDTGAVSLVMPAYAMQQLGLMAREQRVVTYADGRTERVQVTEPVIVQIDGRTTSGEAFVLGDEVLIGGTTFEFIPEGEVRTSGAGADRSDHDDGDDDDQT